MVKLTDIQVRNWLAAGHPIMGKSDGGGLTFTLTAHGYASWTFRYSIGGKRRELTLGHYPNLTLAQARKLARAARSRVDRGFDPAREKRARIEEAAKAERRCTVAVLASDWYTRMIVPKWKHHVKVRQVLDKHVLPIIGRLPAEDVKAADIDRVLDGIVRKGARTVANDALMHLKALFAYGRKRRILEHNPAADFDMADAGGKETPRARALSREELATAITAMKNTASLGHENFLTFLILLATCVRKGELVAAQWAEFELDGGIWHLPEARTKTAAALDIPLASPVVRWLRELRVFAAGSEYVLPARTRSKRYPHISPDTLNVALTRVAHGLEHFTVHDMRRTARTQLAALGVSREIAERTLNHKLRGVEGVYNRHDYFDERRQALALWAGLLDALVEGKPWNVVPITRRQA